MQIKNAIFFIQNLPSRKLNLKINFVTFRYIFYIIQLRIFQTQKFSVLFFFMSKSFNIMNLKHSL